MHFRGNIIKSHSIAQNITTFRLDNPSLSVVSLDYQCLQELHLVLRPKM